MANRTRGDRDVRKAGGIAGVFSILAIPTLVACGGGEEVRFCTAEARTSVQLTIVDPVGASLSDFTVTYRVDNGAAKSMSCNIFQPCPIEFEVSGVFTITAEKAGYKPSSGTVAVTRDECHVSTERLTLTLMPAT
jgi:hypothetical protein